jgi:hypothetical protein
MYDKTCVFNITRVRSVCKDGPEIGDPTRPCQGHIRYHASRTVYRNTHSQRKWSSMSSYSALKDIFVLVSREQCIGTQILKGDPVASGPIPLSRSYYFSYVEDSAPKQIPEEVE